ncbi:MAG: ABC-2 family transporter protein [bacterium]|nr:ABC-2 family transporter protein [bacterium]
MNLYWNIIKFNFFRFWTYPFEVLAVIGKRTTSIIFLTLFWTIIGKYSTNPVNLKDITSYFLIASAVNTFVMAEYTVFGDWISEIIKQGDLNNYLIKPVNILPYLYSTYFGKIGLRLSFSAFTLILGLIISPPQSFTSIGLFIVFLALAIVISFSFNIFIGVLAFYITEVKGIRNSVGHFISILSGASAPLTLFPVGLKEFILLTPFPYMIYGPINGLKTNVLDISVFKGLAISLIWAIALLVLAYLVWQKGIKKYEAIGI